MSSDEIDRSTDGLIDRSLLALQRSEPATPVDDVTIERYRAAIHRVRTDPVEAARVEALAAEFGPAQTTEDRKDATPTSAGVRAPVKVESALVGAGASTRPSGQTATYSPRFLPPGTPAHGVPSAPSGTIFVVGSAGGYAVPPRRFSLLFGRDLENVHVPVGVDDPFVSREHGMITCTGPDGDWVLRNIGHLPIELPGGALLLTGHEQLIEPGYTPLFIISPRQRHLIEVRVAGFADNRRAATFDAPERDPETFDLTFSERLVLTALAERYLQGRDPYPQPRTWQETANIVNGSQYSTKAWTSRTVTIAVERVRVRLHHSGVRGLLRDEIGEPSGHMLNVNLIRALLATTTLTPEDLELLASPK